MRGGLVVHVGCGNGKPTAALRVNDSCIGHGLDTDAGRLYIATTDGNVLCLEAPRSMKKR